MKKYVKVTAEFDCDGNLLPRSIHWNSEKCYNIDNITDVRYTSSSSGDGEGIRYTCVIMGKQRFLFLKDNRWYVLPQIKQAR
ncbi:MAG: hypothetical protein U0K87_02500 [Ruminococcus sp.]|nr:hypothetical protein [Ruminococcus sp.]MEE0857768.1 hypothetical protein [Ruminococcus sp.]MEE1171201.1 hypothetical protein [Ruminococcus sp.]